MRTSIQNLIIRIFKFLHLIRLFGVRAFSKFYCTFLFYINGVRFKSFECFGVPCIHLSINAKCIIGGKFKMNNGAKYSDSGLNGKCRIDVRDSGQLIIGDNVGMSDVTITCHQKIIIGHNVLLGVGTQIRDTDSHSLNSQDRRTSLDWENKKTAVVEIKDNVFIGAYCIVLKGVTVGHNSIIGAGSVVTKNIPDNEIWAGNPAKFIRRVTQ